MDALIKFLYQLEPAFVIVSEATGIAAFLLSHRFKLREQSKPLPPKWIELIKTIANRILGCAAFLVVLVGCLSAYTKIFFTLTPDVLGNSVSEAKQKLAVYELGIEPKEGQNTSDDVITGQSPAAGTPIHKGFNVEVTFTSPPQSSEPPSSEPPSSEPPSSEPPSSEPPSSEPPSSEPPSSEPPSVTAPSIRLSSSSLSMAVGDTESLSAYTTPSGQSVTWSSSNTGVVTVNSNGKVSAVGAGSVTITAEFYSGGQLYTASCIISVKISDIIVTFNAQGGTTSLSNKIVTSGNAYGSLPTPTRSGYTFDGWYTEASGGIQITPNTIVSAAADHTLYAHWLGWGAWSAWSTTLYSASSTREVETRQVKVSDAYTEYRYGLWRNSNDANWCPDYGASISGGSWYESYSSWSKTRMYQYTGHNAFCAGSNHNHTHVAEYDSSGQACWYIYSDDGSFTGWGRLYYYWEETRTIPAVYETQYRYRDLIPS